MFGTEEFDTVVCGYLENREALGGEGEGTPIVVPYLVIVDYKDWEFRNSLSNSVSSGKGMNLFLSGRYYFNCGCLKNNKIIGNPAYKDKDDYLDKATESALLESSPEHPVSVVLSFGLHPGTGCICCNLAHKIRLY
jgi:hypothetical protein